MVILVKRRYRIVVSLVVGLMLAVSLGCGGSGGSGGGAGAIENDEGNGGDTVVGSEETLRSEVGITSNNSVTVSQVALAEVSTAFELTGFDVSVPSSKSDVSPSHKSFLDAFGRDLELQSVILEENLDCPGGGTSTTVFDDADNSATPSAGDSAVTTNVNCVDEFETMTNGSISFDILAFDETPPDLVLSVELIFDDYTSELANTGFVVALDGSILYGFTTDDGVVTIYTLDSDWRFSQTNFNDNELRVAMADTAYEVTVDGATGLYSRTGYTTVDHSDLDGAVNVEIIEPMVGFVNSPPYQGVVLATGVNGSSLTVTVLDSTQVRLDLDTDGDGTIDSSEVTTR